MASVVSAVPVAADSSLAVFVAAVAVAGTQPVVHSFQRIADFASVEVLVAEP